MNRLIVDKDTQLRLLTQADADALNDCVQTNIDYLSEYIETDYMKDLTAVQAYIENLSIQYDVSVAIFMGLFYKERLIGMRGFHNIALNNYSAEIGGWIDFDHQGQGISKTSTVSLMAYAFEVLGLNRLTMLVVEHNAPSIKLCEALGFRLESTEQASVFLNGQFKNRHVYVAFKKDWFDQKKENINDSDCDINSLFE